MNDATLNFSTATGHEILATAGKKYLRPGGRQATETLLSWANLQPGDTVLELASSFGDSAIALAKRHNVRVIGIEKNPDSVARAKANIAAAGLSDRVEVREGNIFHLDELPEQFDCILAEAILTMQSPAGKAKILTAICDRLKPGGQFLCHELLARQRETEIHQALAQAIRVNSTPLSKSNWIAACEAAGLDVQQKQTGEMGLLNLRRSLEDEGLLNTMRIILNVLTNPPLRQRVLFMRQVLQSYQPDLGYILLRATRH